MGKKSKTKGSRFERTVCRLLTVWVTGQEKPSIFWRSPTSGAQLARVLDPNLSGDIVAVDEKGAFLCQVVTIECKHHKTFDFVQFPFKKGALYRWWMQACKSAEESYKEPWLIFKRDRSEIYLMMNKRFQSRLTKFAGDVSFPYMFISFDLHSLFVCRLLDFLNWVSATCFKESTREFLPS